MLLNSKNRLIKLFLDLTLLIKLSLNSKLLSESLLDLRLLRKSLNSFSELLRLKYLRLERRS